ncbi:hypothetical protein [Pleionea sediminis]|uniref:hypothetical protein n=1 Tax=Pleionea sediminis TaxID=2569479 RepID=UPI001184D9C1|nr:hypothetical protein [Pleionea sediminis]
MKQSIRHLAVVASILSLSNAFATEPESSVDYIIEKNKEFISAQKHIESVEIEKILIQNSQNGIHKNLISTKALIQSGDLSNYNYKVPVEQFVSKSAKTQLTMDGYYSEKVFLKATQRGSKLPVEQLHWNYYRVIRGNVELINSSEYSKAVDKPFHVYENGKLTEYNQGQGIRSLSFSKPEQMGEAIRVDKPSMKKYFDTSEQDEQ